MTMKTTLAAGALAALLGAAPASAAAPPGTPAPGTPGALDASFGSTSAPRSPGVVLGPQGTSFRAVAVQPDGKVLAAGRFGSQVAVARYTVAGTPDPSFGSGGLATFTVSDGGADSAGATGVAVLPDGRIALGGELGRNGGNAGILAMRLQANGARDTSFDGDGAASVLTGDFAATGQGLVVDGAGRLLVAGSSRPTGDTGARATVVRFTTTGAPDASFAGDGIEQFHSADTATEAGAIALQPDGRIVAAGSATNFYGAQESMIYRLDAAGNLDAGFAGYNFHKQYARDAAASRFTSVAVAADGTITAAGTAVDLSGADGIVARLSPAGVPVAGFGPGGFVRQLASDRNTTAGRFPYPGFAALLARPGTLYAAGPVEASGSYRLLSLSALRAGDGAALPGFGAPVGPDYAQSLGFTAASGTTYTFVDGATTQPFNGPQGQTSALALSPDGTRLIAAGTTGSGIGQTTEPSDVRGFVARYVAAPEPEPAPQPQPQPQPEPQPQPQPVPPAPVGGSSQDPTPVRLPLITASTITPRAIDARHRATLRFTLPAATTIRMTLERATGSAPRVFRKVAGRRVIAGRAGVNRITISRRWDGRTLRRGSYRAVLRNADSTSVRRVGFRVR